MSLSKKKHKIMDTSKSSSSMDWIIFLVATAVLILLLIFANEWFWLALPFSLTYLAKALKVL